jgi:hypothetical protein
MGWYVDDTTFCDELIKYHKHPDTVKEIGKVGLYPVEDKETKESTDSSYRPDMLDYFKFGKHLFNALNSYTNRYPESTGIYGYSHQQAFNVQHYPKGGGFKTFHNERFQGDYPNVNRQLAWMAYLNTVEDNGGTEFLYQGITIKAEKGLILIWPADWTHTHRGIVSTTEEKWIVTGWVHLNKGN